MGVDEVIRYFSAVLLTVFAIGFFRRTRFGRGLGFGVCAMAGVGFFCLFGCCFCHNFLLVRLMPS